MPITSCNSDGKPGFSWGKTSKCWTYTPGDEASKNKAKSNCIKQAIAIEGPERFKAIQEGHSKGELDDVMKAIISDPTSTLDEVTCAASLYQGQPLDRIIINDIIKNKGKESAQASVLKSISDAGKDKLRTILATLRAQEQLYFTSHWQSAGSNFYGQHLLFERLYDAQQDQYDALAEKLVCACGKEIVDPVKQITIEKELLTDWVKTDNAVERGLASEKELQGQIKATYDYLKEHNELTPGLDDYLLALSNEHDTNSYLLGQVEGGK